MLSFGNFSNFVQANSVLLDGLTCAVAATTVTFDAFAMDIFLPLSNGLPVILASEDECMDQIKLEKLLENNPNCYLFMTPTRLMELLKNRINQKIMENVSMMIVGGEIFSGELYQLIRASGKNTKIVNIYGPTETTIFATSREVNTDRGINIGSPAANTKIHILDQDGLSVPVGAIGELYIAGDGVGLGYRNNETLTKERYLDNPYGKGKIYRTGDMAKWNRKGSIDFLGRIDTQVKFHGQRIELGEIENCMNSYEGITASSVMVRERGSESFLCGYFTSKIPVSPEKLKEYLGERLTYYMVPAVLVPLEEMPHTTSGKIDRKALPDVAFKAEVLACETELQEKLQYMVKRVIGLDEIGRNTDLYSCGMTSLSAIRINTLIAQELGYELKTKDILKHPTIEQLEALILSATPRDSDRQQPITAAENGAAQYPLTANQLGLYLEYEKDVQAINYNIPMLYTFDRSIDASKLRNAIYEALEAHPYLNTCLKETEGGMVQIPNQRTEDIPILKMSRTQLKEYMKGFVRPFNLFAAPLYRMAVIETKEALYLCFDIHHIIYDGESSAIFMESVSRAPRQERSSYVPQQERSSYVPRQ